MEEREIINAARQGFDPQLHTPEYRKIHADDEQLDGILRAAAVSPGKNYLDLGTGNGYLAFALAERFPDSCVYGLDISSDSIERNAEIARQRGIPNARFESYSGFEFPFENKMFSGSFSRYAFHHFPNVERSIAEIRRTLEPGGFFFFSDPKTFEDDVNGFVDAFQSLLPDGHVHFYRRSEIEQYFRRFGFSVETEFESSVSYPRRMSDDYAKLLSKTEDSILEKYQIEVADDTVNITVRVMNILFRRDT